MKKQRFHWYDNSSFENAELKLSFPIMNNTETMIVAQVFSSTKLIGIGYFEFEK